MGVSLRSAPPPRPPPFPLSRSNRFSSRSCSDRPREGNRTSSLEEYDVDTGFIYSSWSLGLRDTMRSSHSADLGCVHVCSRIGCAGADRTISSARWVNDALWLTEVPLAISALYLSLVVNSVCQSFTFL